MSNVARFTKLVAVSGSPVVYHRESGGVDCPCLTEEGYRNRRWHLDNPEGVANPSLAFPPWNGVNPPVCNEEGKQAGTILNATVRAFVQPVQSGATRRLTTDYAVQLFGEVQMDDHLGIFPLTFGGVTFDFQEWSQAGEDYLIYNGRRFLVVNANLIPDPADGSPHHWETGLRLVKPGRAI